MSRLIRKVRKLALLLQQAGPSHVAHVLYVSYLLPVVMSVLDAYAPFHPKVRKALEMLQADGERRRWRERKAEVIAAGERGYRLALEDLGLSPAGLEDVRARLASAPLVVVADIDQDGYLLSHFGAIDGARTVTRDEYFPRKRFTLQVVTDGRTVGVRKNYGGDHLSFVTELAALHTLGAAGCRVPAILDADFDANTLTFSYIKGRELRLELAAQGADLLDRVILARPGYDALSGDQRRRQQIDAGRPHLDAVVTPAFVEQAFAELRKMHGAGLIWKDIKYGNMLIAAGTGEAYLIDFDTAYDYSGTSPLLFRLLADANIEEFNRCFGTSKLTWRRVREQLRAEQGKKLGYSTAYFGYGLRSGNLLKNYVGYGRWHFMMKTHLPSLAGARLLDIGANDAVQSLQALRHGAREAIAIERHSEPIARGLWLREVFEWSDNRSYDFRYVQTDMSKIAEMDLGRFDFAMALCSIYYLDDEGIAALIRHLRTITDTLLLMGNTEEDIGRTDPREYEKASVPYTVRAMTANGFPQTQVIAPPNYSRPLVIGRAT